MKTLKRLNHIGNDICRIYDWKHKLLLGSLIEHNENNKSLTLYIAEIYKMIRLNIHTDT
jgi:hypothetical protein